LDGDINVLGDHQIDRESGMKNSSDQQRKRDGFTTIELVVSAAMLVVVMTFTATLIVKIDHIWKEIGHHRIALNELSNQLDRLTHLEPAALEHAMESIAASPEAQRTLASPNLTAQRVNDEFGDRIVLRLDWRRRYPGRAVELVAWLSMEETP